MVEGVQIDWAGYVNDQEYMIIEMLDFDEVVGEVLVFVKCNKEILVIVMADYEIGGYVIQLGFIRDFFIVGWIVDNYIVSFVFVFVYGLWVEFFWGIYENIVIYDKMV